MGIKTLRETYGNGFIVQKVENGDITIGSGYASDLIRIKPDLKITKSDIVTDGGNIDMIYKSLIEAKESGELERVLLAQDEYTVLHNVYLAEDGKVIKKQCEAYEWPNTTTDGQLLYDNTSFKTRNEALLYLRKESIEHVKTTFEVFINTIRFDLTKRFIRFAKYSFRAFRAWVLFGY